MLSGFFFVFWFCLVLFLFLFGPFYHFIFGHWIIKINWHENANIVIWWTNKIKGSSPTQKPTLLAAFTILNSHRLSDIKRNKTKQVKLKQLTEDDYTSLLDPIIKSSTLLLLIFLQLMIYTNRPRIIAPKRTNLNT